MKPRITRIFTDKPLDGLSGWLNGDFSVSVYIREIRGLNRQAAIAGGEH
jgi:hypothetical protein